MHPVAYLFAALLAQDPAILQIHVVEGEGGVYILGSRATRGVTVQVSDETGKPVEAATVSFRLPEEGPGGTFATGAKTEIATTRSDGRAGVWGMQWNRTAGSFEIRITAVKGNARAGTVCLERLSDAPESAGTGSRIGPAHGHKWLWITLAVAGAAAGGVAAAAFGGKPGTTVSSSASGVQIGTPTITVGPR